MFNSRGSVAVLLLLGISLLFSSVATFAQDDILGDIEAKAKKTQAAEKSPAEPSPQTGEAAEPTQPDQPPAGDESSPGKDQQSGDESSDGEAAAEEESGSEEPGRFAQFLDSGALGLLLAGGIFMWPILLMGILAVGVIIERYRSLKMLKVDDFKIRHEVQELLYDDKIEEALALCDQEQGPVPAVLSAGLRKYYVLRKLNYDAARTEEQVVKAMDDYSVHIVAGLERHIPVLATISSVAPMLGFLGTVQGMIVAFQQIVEKMGETNIVEAAASGIQVSLLTTCFGLIVGIPAFVAFNYFTSVINNFVLQVEQSATDLIEGVTIQLAAAGDPVSQGNQE
ncbi:MAG: MotA/TolQ/ExbB proton channel family protein [Pirellulaceae bacterium]